MSRFLLIFTAALAIAQAQTVTVLHSFGNGTDGYEPECTLTEVSPRVFLGTTSDTIFQSSSSGAFTTLYTFNVNTQGGDTLGLLYPASNGVLYGANDSGNGTYTGSLFVTTTAGQVQLLQSDSYLASPLIEASDGNLYGIEGNATTGSFDVFRMTRTGTITNIYNLGPNAQSYGPLFQANDGNLYGMTLGTGPGTIFKLSLSGHYSLVHTFQNGEGGVGGLMQASNGLLYGVAANAFPAQCPRIGSFIFSLSLSGQFKTYTGFGGCPTGINVPPVIAGLMEASDGNLYGAAQVTWGAGQNGLIFMMSLDGSSFHPIVDMGLTYGIGPGGINGAGLIQASDGALYGTARNGGTYQFGTVFRIDLGLTPPPPVIGYMSPSSAEPNTAVIVEGQHLLGVSAVSFNGVAAKTIVSRGTNYVLAVVPPGATSGPITVTTPNGSVTSKASFTVQ